MKGGNFLNKIKKQKKEQNSNKIIALVGNPNVGKSTIFNELTGLKQHTGNWSGKTVGRAQGYVCIEKENICLVDLPGTYSLMSHSKEEEIARDYICFGEIDAAIVVCDATCLERNLLLVLQTMEIVDKVIVCVNLIDEAKGKKIKVDIDKLSNRLGVDVIATSARTKQGLKEVLLKIKDVCNRKNKSSRMPLIYSAPIEEAINILEPIIKKKVTNKINSRWLSLRFLDYDKSLIQTVTNYFGKNLLKDKEVVRKLREAKQVLLHHSLYSENLKDKIISDMIYKAEDISKQVVSIEKEDHISRDYKIDRILTNKWTGFPVMILLFAIIFWITITGANYPSQFLSDLLFYIQDKLMGFFIKTNIPAFLYEMLILGVYRVLAWVISVMLPPMAIFFPLFTLLEDLGYLPRIAFNLDRCFKHCCACGKQALTMCIVADRI